MRVIKTANSTALPLSFNQVELFMVGSQVYLVGLTFSNVIVEEKPTCIIYSSQIQIEFLRGGLDLKKSSQLIFD